MSEIYISYTYTFIYYLLFIHIKTYIIRTITIHTYVYTYFTYPLRATRCVFSHRRTYSSRSNPTPTSPISHHIQLHSRKGLVTCIYNFKLVALIIHELYQTTILILLTTHHEERDIDE